MKKKIKIGLIAAIACVVIAIPAYLLVASNMAASSIVHIDSEQTEKNSDDFLKKVGFDEEAFELKWKSSSEKIQCLSNNNNSVYLNYICCKEYKYDNTTIILVPPYGFDYTVMSPIADVLLDQGYNIVMFDQRSHGRNNADSFTFGSLECDDIDTVYNYIEANAGDKPAIGIFGQGTGASTAACFIGRSGAYQLIDFAILEDPFSSAEDKFDILMSNKKSLLPDSVYNGLTKGAIKSKYDFDINSINIAQQVSGTGVPVLVMNQSDCSQCPFTSSSKVYDSIENKNKKLVTFDGAEYLKLFYSQNEKYVQSVTDFISENS